MTSNRPRALLVSLVALTTATAAACGAPSSPSPSPFVPSPSPAAAAAQPLIIDVDLDVSDLLAVAILARDPAFDVRALTVAGTGIVHCEGGLRLGRGLLDALGRADVPVACGRESAGGAARPFPEEWRAAADRAWGMSIADVDPGTDTGTATALISRVAAETQGSIAIFAAGPLTNIADALAADAALAPRISVLHVMGGVVDALGNVVIDDLRPGDRLEWNFVADPDAVAAVLATSVPVSLVPLDATDDVPVPSDLPAWLAEDHAAAGADIAYELILRQPGRITDPGSQLWDELAALAMSQPDLVTWEAFPLTATTTGRTAGHVERDPAGRQVRVAVAADRPRVESALLEALRRGPPRSESFAFAGEARILWDGAACAWDGAAPSKAGLHRLSIENRTASDAGGFVAGVVSPKTWADLGSFLESVDLSVEVAPPPWILQIGSLSVAAGRQTTGIVDMPAGVSGVVCASGTWPDLTFVASPPATLVD